MTKIIPMMDFKIHPFPYSKLYWRVLVFYNKKEMHQYIKLNEWDRGWGLGRCWDGLCRSYVTYDSKDRKQNERGTIFLNGRLLNSKVISHECAHAALAYVKGRGVAIDSEKNNFNEELFCYALCHLNDAIWVKINKFFG